MLLLDGEMLLPIRSEEAPFRLDDYAIREEDEIRGVAPRLGSRGVLDDELFVLVRNLEVRQLLPDGFLKPRPPPVFQGSGSGLRASELQLSDSFEQVAQFTEPARFVL